MNAAVALRGPSGTARIIDLIRDAAELSGHEVALMTPTAARRGKVANALASLRWDFRDFARSAPASDVFISPTNTGLVTPRPHLLWMQDTMVLDHPKWFDRDYVYYARTTFGFSAQRATLVVTASEAARSRILAHWPQLSDRLRVLPWPALAQKAPARDCMPTRLTVLMLGATEPHKGHVVGIDAVRMARIATGAQIELRVVGPTGRAEDDVRRALLTADPTGTWTQRQTLPDRKAIVTALDEAWVLLQCSYDEGFCLPLVESAARALPAVHTGTGSMAEVHPAGYAGATDSFALSVELERLLEPGAYTAASRAAAAIAASFSAEAFARGIDDLLSEVSP
jgi:hypothetical protein